MKRIQVTRKSGMAQSGTRPNSLNKVRVSRGGTRL